MLLFHRHAVILRAFVMQILIKKTVKVNNVSKNASKAQNYEWNSV